jgi:ketopantoate hydroxymethyltransferase
VLDFQKMKNEGRKISVVTCYDYSSARAVAASNIDCILVDDSVAMVMHGHATTLSATTAMIALHTAAVARGAPAKFIVADLCVLWRRPVHPIRRRGVRAQLLSLGLCQGARRSTLSKRVGRR